MSRAPLTAPRSETITIKQGGQGGRRECLVKEAGVMVQRGVGVPLPLKDDAELSGASPTGVQRAGGRGGIGRKHNLSPHLHLFPTHGKWGLKSESGSNICGGMVFV